MTTMRWLKRNIVPALCFAILIAYLLTSVFANYLATHSPLETNLTERLLPPMFVEGGDQAHLLGTDPFGRDVLSRLLYGGRISDSFYAHG